MSALLSLLMIVGVRSPLQAQVLPLIHESFQGEVAFWWAEPNQPRYTPFDAVLTQQAADILIDVRTMDSRPQVSRIYRVADLSATNARNMAGLYGARMVLLGALSLDQARPVAGNLFWVVICELDCRLISVDADIVYLEATRQFIGQGTDPSSAFTSAREQAARYLLQRLQRASQGPMLSASPGDIESPTLVVSGLETARPLVAFKGDLRRHLEVVADVREVWASEGLIALQVDMVTGQGPEAIDAVLQSLVGTPDTDYQLIIEGRTGLVVDIRLVPIPSDEIDMVEQTDDSTP